MNTRIETDSFGPIEVPAHAYWGAQTERSVENFPFGAAERMPIGIVHALAIVKQAAARVNRRHGLDPALADAIEGAAAEIAASRTQLLDGISRAYDLAEAGRPVTFEQRATIRRNQVRCAWRAVTAADQIFARSGGNALRLDQPLQRFWRDAHAGLHHAIHTPAPGYLAPALIEMGLEPSPAQKALI